MKNLLSVQGSIDAIDGVASYLWQIVGVLLLLLILVIAIGVIYRKLIK